jgi:hypothetical protein
VTAFETRERTRLLAGEKPKGRVGLATGRTRVIGRSLASQLGRSADDVARVAHFLCADACSLITG